MTRLGELWGDCLFYFALITFETHINVPNYRSTVHFGDNFQNYGWATFLRIFSPTHPATLSCDFHLVIG
jgi:hypothetical protein